MANTGTGRNYDIHKITMSYKAFITGKHMESPIHRIRNAVRRNIHDDVCEAVSIRPSFHQSSAIGDKSRVNPMAVRTRHLSALPFVTVFLG